MPEKISALYLKVAHHPDQRVDHDNADKDQHKVLEETADFMGGRKFHFRSSLISVVDPVLGW